MHNNYVHMNCSNIRVKDEFLFCNTCLLAVCSRCINNVLLTSVALAMLHFQHLNQLKDLCGIP